MNIVTVTMVVLYTAAMLGAWWYDPEVAYITIFVFLALGIGFFAVGMVMVRLLKRHFVEFYEKMGAKLIGATMLLSIPMFLRALNWICQEQIDSYYNLYYNNISYSNAIYAILTTIVPVGAQMASLIFGALNKQNKQKSKGVNEYKSLRESAS
jgi:hypothetical protein